ncbi:MAG: hypothetical protein JO113_05780 [Candidatus Eremiobacteraeota bacterium]|nr:hypothetical protein [Candidatus Eremiobacteraeota bacterium]
MRYSRSAAGFCVAIAVIAAAIADPIVEFASNAGWFGTGNFTDHSSIDVMPALLAGIGLLALYLARKARAVLSDRAPEAFAALLPASYGLQIFTLYVMESLEQLAVCHHTLGPTVWLGAPAPISLAVHAAVCTVVALMLLRSKRSLARATLRVIAIIRAIATLSPAIKKPFGSRLASRICFIRSSSVCCAIGERAPPIAAF